MRPKTSSEKTKIMGVLLFWSGYGFLVPVIVFLDSLIAELITMQLSGDEDLYQKNLIPLGVSFIISGLIIMSLANYFENKKKENKGTRVFDKVTISKSSHFFFIPFKYWTYIAGAAGIIVVIIQFFKK